MLFSFSESHFLLRKMDALCSGPRTVFYRSMSAESRQIFVPKNHLSEPVRGSQKWVCECWQNFVLTWLSPAFSFSVVQSVLQGSRLYLFVVTSRHSTFFTSTFRLSRPIRDRCLIWIAWLFALLTYKSNHNPELFQLQWRTHSTGQKSLFIHSPNVF